MLTWPFSDFPHPLNNQDGNSLREGDTVYYEKAG